MDVTHQNVCNLVCLAPGNLGIREGVHVGQVLNISFDMGKLPKLRTHTFDQVQVINKVIAAWEIFACLCNGGTLVLRGSKWEEALQKVGQSSSF